MKKRLIRLSLVLALMLCLSVSVFAESQLWHITDDAGILTESQNIELETYAENISQDYGVGVYVVTVDNYEDYYDSAYETAWQIYHAYELGEGADRDGVILLLSMDNRQFATFFYGPRAEYAFDKHGQEKLEDYVLDHFRADLQKNAGSYRTAEQIATDTNLSKVTVRRYLNYLIGTNEAESQVDYSTGGRPRVEYRSR